MTEDRIIHQENQYGIIQLTRGQVAIVDVADISWLTKRKWFADFDKKSGNFYAKTNHSIVKNGKPAQMQLRMHREITQAARGYHVDHINHNTLDNRRANLRVCSCAANAANRLMYTGNKSGFKGVSFNKGSNKWVANIMAERKQYHIGKYNTAIEAAIAYDKAAVGLKGEFALTNRALGLIPDNYQSDGEWSSIGLAI